MDNKTFSYLNGNTIELHYWLKSQSHSMDAFVQNKCERELLSLIEEITHAFKSPIIIETEPFGEGGLRRWFTIKPGVENNKGVVTTALVVALTTGIIATPITTTLSETAKALVGRIFEDPELKILQKDMQREQIRNLQVDTELKLQQLSENSKVIQRRSNFYSTLEKYGKADKITFSIEDHEKSVQAEINISRSDFDKFIMVSNDLESIIDRNAEIEIIAPILKKGKYKWKGIYEGKVLNFNMKSDEFKTLVQTGEVEFKNGSSINCVLEIKRKINNIGEEVITSYDIVQVND